MDFNFPGAYASLILLSVFLVAFIFFLYTQQRILQLITPEQSRMQPGQVWLQLIPVFGWIWQFVVISRLASSIHNALTSSSGDSVFDIEEKIPARPTFVSGITYAICIIVAAIPLPYGTSIFAAVALGNWIAYWIDLNRYRKKIKSRAQLIS